MMQPNHIKAHNQLSRRSRSAPSSTSYFSHSSSRPSISFSSFFVTLVLSCLLFLMVSATFSDAAAIPPGASTATGTKGKGRDHGYAKQAVINKRNFTPPEGHDWKESDGRNVNTLPVEPNRPMKRRDVKRAYTPPGCGDQYDKGQPHATY
ncbi:hypothetical protein BX616_005430 [Lobosporangium transversale]|uniref:Uncharacterized protein n=1 Tax=Lobosporangium transversale TaxID=64571 RepID=A0A1Y2GHZ2_9FUNG|nr:hypothetical protein BCR41DRAFT_423371 [Lobosporangium transversale]KAF9918816.1 hypothetical protein BX616_005430 [Lobosporangium transversale]ORZ11632.1 hypothetical protein BCR41DRAFT_423371 [Lobosporangium transversale]|eukprot:XP_021879729.1 hypothetical protein BCR41DRAFT_423371 [Lobosporangium transversale]